MTSIRQTDIYKNRQRKKCLSKAGDTRKRVAHGTETLAPCKRAGRKAPMTFSIRSICSDCFKTKSSRVLMRSLETLLRLVGIWKLTTGWEASFALAGAKTLA